MPLQREFHDQHLGWKSDSKLVANRVKGLKLHGLTTPCEMYIIQDCTQSVYKCVLRASVKCCMVSKWHSSHQFRVVV